MNTTREKSEDLRFKFGENWSNYLLLVDEERINQATAMLSATLGDMRDKTFLEIGSGSGIHSLSAARLGARQVFSFDNDPQSVECTREMKKRFAPGTNWHVEQGSVLDEQYMRSLGQFDVVYSWGVLHHTGKMWKALEMATIPVREKLMIAIYNDQGLVSRSWAKLKKLYVKHPATRPAVTLASLGTIWGPKVLLQPHRVVSDWKSWYQKRGMSAWHDVVDWAGGYPYEFSSPDEIVSFVRQRGYHLESLHKFGRIISMFEYVFLKEQPTNNGMLR
jgi:SAM-dependent methyltransferase